MNLQSCSSCGVVVDLDRLVFPPTYDSDGTTTKAAVWDGDEFVSSLSCPVCDEGTFLSNGEVMW
jgi:hypothetical protein